jgi:hypothetical protein
MIYLVTLLVVIVLLNIRVFDTRYTFLNMSINMLMLISLYALFITKGNSQFIIVLPLIILTYFRKLKLGYDVDGLKESLMIFPFVWPFFLFMVFMPGGEMKVPNVDYVYYGRLSHWIHYNGIESSNILANLLDDSTIKPNYYHFAEIWLTNLLYRINGGTGVNTLHLCVYPLVAIISVSGILYLVKSVLGFSLDKVGVRLLSTGAIVIILLFSSGAFESIHALVNHQLLNGRTGALINECKLILCFPAVVGLLLYIRNQLDNPVISVILSFLYLSVFLPVTASIILIEIFKISQSRKITLNQWLPLLALLGFFVFYLVNSDPRLVGSSGSILDSFHHLQIPVTYLKWFVKAYILVGLSWSIVIFYFGYFLNMFSGFQKLQVLIIFVMASLTWLVLYTTPDSGQMMSNIVKPLLTVILILVFFDAYISKRLVFFILLILFYIIPLENMKVYARSSINKEVLELTEKYKDYFIGFIYDPSKVNTIYRYSDAYYSHESEIFIQDEDLRLIYFSSAYPLSNKLSQDDRKYVLGYRKFSPYFQECGEFEISKSDCLVDYVIKYNINLLISELPIENDRLLLKDQTQHYFIYLIR